MTALWARMEDGERAYKNIRWMMGAVTFSNLVGKNGPHIYQIDGSLGAIAAVAEMLLQRQHRGSS
jgi:alpha-L-fucosidase 2